MPNPKIIDWSHPGCLGKQRDGRALGTAAVEGEAGAREAQLEEWARQVGCSWGDRDSYKIGEPQT